jgi:hypothetical protein
VGAGALAGRDSRFASGKAAFLRGFHFVEHYARWDHKIDDRSVSPPIREEAIVEMLSHTYELLSTAQNEVAQLRERLKKAEERLVKAEARSDLLASAYATLGVGKAR